MATMIPKLEEVKYLHEPVTPGEMALLERLDQWLDETYEVFFQPRVNGNHMDVVVLREGSGALIIEVKDWHLESYEITDGRWSVNTQRGPGPLAEDPVEQVTRYREALYRLYLNGFAETLLSNKNMFAMIGRCVFFYNASTQEIEERTDSCYKGEEYLELVGRDFLENEGYFRHVMWKMYLSRPSKFFTEDWYKELKRLLQPSMHTRENISEGMEEFELNPQQKRLARSRAGRQQKVCGPAGSGKTRLLAYIAAHAWQRLNGEEPRRKMRKEILILTFNITLRNYIHDALRDVPEEFSFDDIIIMHYHLFIYLYAHGAFANEVGRDMSDVERVDAKVDPKTYKVQKPDRKFPVILVDEVQDFERFWIDNIWSMLEDDGELVFFGDEHQNIYGRKLEADADKNPRPYTGIGGRWNVLKKTYRTATLISDFANAFREKFLPEYSQEKMDPVMMEDLFAKKPNIVYYGRVPEPEEVYAIVQTFVRENDLSQNDIAFLCSKRDDLRDIDAVYRKNELETTTVFETKETYERERKKLWNMGVRGAELKEALDAEFKGTRRSKKFNFRMETGKTKLTTVHSFKGWELNTVVLISREPDETHGKEQVSTEELIYTGITRARLNLIVFNAYGVFDDFVRDYQRKLPEDIEMRK